MSELNINLLNTEINTSISEFYDNMSSHFSLTSLNQQDWQKILIDNIFLNSFKFETFSGNLTSLISDHLPQILILLKGFHRKSTVKNNSDYERNYRFFNGNEFKNVLKSIPLENILSKVNLSASSAIQQVFSNLYEKMHTHAYWTYSYLA